MQPGFRERPVFGVGERVLTWNDVLDWAARSRELAGLEHETALGLAALERDGPPAAADVHAAGAAFRYARGLLAADELEAWLVGWELTTDDWLAHLRRVLARESGSEPQSPDDARKRGGEAGSGALRGDSGSEPQSPCASAAAGEADVLTDAICSGELERWAGELAARHAVAPGADGDELEERFAAFCRDAVTEDAVAREVEGRRLDWLRVEGELVSLPDEDVAREVALCAREDGEPLDELAARAGAGHELLDSYLDDVRPELAAALLGAREGEVVGPLPIDGAFVVGRARRKTAPSPGDPAVRERAAALVLRRVIDREVEARVRWLVQPGRG